METEKVYTSVAMMSSDKQYGGGATVGYQGKKGKSMSKNKRTRSQSQTETEVRARARACCCVGVS